MGLTKITYVAGLLEGEGCFTYSNNSPLIQLSMTGRDVVAKFRNIVCPDSEITNRHTNPSGKVHILVEYLLLKLSNG